MKIKLALSVIVFAAAVSMTAPTMVRAADATTSIATEAASHKQVPVPQLKLVQTIDLRRYIGSADSVSRLSFSPDGRYLAIVLWPDTGADNDTDKTDIVVWSMEKEKPQSHIHCSDHYVCSYVDGLQWSRDGKVISYGVKRQWNAMTGKALSDNPVVGDTARLNKDGSKMLTIVRVLGESSYIYIYDTSTWQVQKMYVDGLYVRSAVWTAEGNILVDAEAGMLGKTLDGYTMSHIGDAAIGLLDPNGKKAMRAIWFPMTLWQRADVWLSAVSFNANMVTLGDGQLINGKTLRITTYFSSKDIDNSKVRTGAGGMAFDPSGKFLFIKDSGVVEDGDVYSNRRSVTNSIIDTATGKVLAHFAGGSIGIAVRPDGKRLAIGDGDRVQVLSIE